jgi:hypothetical protein
MEKRFLGAAAATSLALAANSGAASAAEVISIPLNELLANGGSYNGLLNLSAFLAPSGGPAKVVTAATLSAFGYSDAQAAFSHSQTQNTLLSSNNRSVLLGYYSYSCGWFSTCYSPYYGTATDRTYRSDQTSYYQDQLADVLALTAGDQLATDIADQQTSVTPFVYTGSATTGSDYQGFTVTYYSTREQTSGYYGNLFAQLGLDAANLADINDDGLFNFAVSAQLGQFKLSEVSLQFELGDAPITTAVPEAQTWAMMIAGLGVVGASLRRRRKTGAVTA